MTIAKTNFEKFQNNRYSEISDDMKKLATGQSPEVLFITCSDSRVMPNEITQTNAGELFVIRNAGNLIPAYDKKQSSAEALTVQYAVDVLGVKEVVVCGHTSCGAMDGILNLDKLTGLECVHHHLSECASHFDSDTLNELRNDSEGLPKLINKNVETQIKNIMSYPFIQTKLQSGELKVLGWVYDFVNGKLVHEVDAKSFL